jgi:hypothetical protein
VKVTGHQKVVSTFREIKSRAESRWRELHGGQPVIMVGAATCGRAAGAMEVLQAIKKELKKQKLDCPVIEEAGLSSYLLPTGQSSDSPEAGQGIYPRR